MKPVTIVKLGGSAITHKSKECTPNLRVVQQSADQLASYRGPLIILHGGGSYAHPSVTRAALQKGYKHKSQLSVIAETGLLLDQLTRIVGVSLLRRGKPFVNLRPMSFVTMRDGKIENVFLGPLMRALEIGLTPLIHGDLVFDSVRGVSIVSADRMASLLGIRLRPARVLFGCDVDGVFSENPRDSTSAHLIEIVDQNNAREVFRKLQAVGSHDATGGMFGKAKEAIRLAQQGQESLIFNLTKRRLLGEALLGALSRGTRFVSWETA